MKKKAMSMAVTLMVLKEKMRNTIYKYGLLFSIGMFLFFSFSSIALAVNYGSGLYGSGLYGLGALVATPSAGTFTSSKSVTLTSTGSSSIKYSTSSIPATCSDGTLATGAITVSESQTIYARACDANGDSVTGSFAYVINRSSGGSGGGGGPNLCPSGTTGTYPNCVSNNVCPSGTTGTYPNCVSNGGGLNVCPSGTTGIYPNCIMSGCQPGDLFSTITGQACTAYTLCEPGALFSPTTGQPCTAYTSYAILLTFSRTLKLTSPRMTGNDVKDLQTYLNTHGYDVGTADGIFGTKTKAIVILFQRANGLTPDGAVGPKTVNYMNTGQLQTPAVASPYSPSTFTRTLKLISPRMTGNDVKDLQTYLSTHGYNAGISDGVFGSGTKSAVILFQKAKGLTADGAVGPKTRELMK